MPTLINSEPEKFYLEDMQGNASLSETLMNKIGASHNFIFDYFIAYHFGVSGAPYSSLSAYPYTFSNNMENVYITSQITNIEIFNEISGTAGTTEFRIERQLAAGGAWTNIFSTNCSILNTAADNLSFKNTGSAPAGVTLPVISISSLAPDDKLRFVLISAATGAQNLKIKINTRPVG
jgi:hypothetical protein